MSGSSSTPGIVQTREIEIIETREIEKEVGIKQTREINRLVVEEKWKDVLKLCREAEPRRLMFECSLTLAEDNILHLAVRKPLVLKKLLILGGELVEPALFKKNAYGNMPLHEAAAAGYAEATELLVNKCGDLINMKNDCGETAFCWAARFGHKKVLECLFKFLKDKDKEDPQQLKEHYTGEGFCSILHVALYNRRIGTALRIQRKIGENVKLDPPFYKRKDEKGMTCLQVLASTPTFFKSGYTADILTSIIYYCVDGVKEDCSEECRLTSFVHTVIFGIKKAFRIFMATGWPMINDIHKKKKKHQQAVILAILLAENDFSWEESYNKKWKVSKNNTQHQSGGVTQPEIPQTSQSDVSRSSHEHLESIHPKSLTLAAKNGKIEIVSKSKQIEQDVLTPLLLATKNGIIEIVTIILNEYPQATDHVSTNCQNIWHVTILHRQRKIFRLLKKIVVTLKHRMVGRADANGNTILHQAAITDYCREDDFPNPAYQLQEELHWFERAKKFAPAHFLAIRNFDQKLPRDYFEETHRDQLEKAKEWSKETSQSCSTVGALIATIVFAAAYTVPGGSENGVPILLHVTLFKVFTYMDMISLGSSLTSVVLFLSILSSPYKYDDFKDSIPKRTTLGFTFLLISITTAMVAFIVTIMLTISLETDWTRSIIYFVGFLPVSVFALLHLPLIAGFKGTWKEIRKVIKRVCPKCILNGFQGIWKETRKVLKRVCPECILCRQHQTMSRRSEYLLGYSS